MSERLVVGITGASGAIYGIRLLERLRELPVETHLVVSRAADVTLKERRPLVLVVRETPLSAVHLANLTRLAELGVTIFPPAPAFYNRPQTIDDIVGHTVLRVLDQLDFGLESDSRWTGLS